ncbi:MAG TPA: ThuA domain-containing protein [Actinophytocola sp.]|uniref:ThuA domain-containing protein n=1 Tax=Actinophytocola sp. TaxID=1872138 RepID=UPI002DDD0D85|nr:ThuA domain-containing protein [Actinophytocola sp.]HEV2783925.1 ThuA domain-containing protein [Actinophytocola sp.]
MSRSVWVLVVSLLVLAGVVAAPPAAQAAPRFSVLVFSRVNGFFHDSIPAGKAAITELGAQHNFAVTVSDDAGLFTDAGLAPFDAVIFNNTNGRDGAVLDANQRAALQRYVRAGNGFVGIHSASGSDRDWPWYDAMLGAKFTTHPAIQQVSIQVDDRVHPSTRNLPQNWVRTEEPYDFNVNPRGGVHVLASFDTRSYTGHGMGADHPIAWCQDFEGGRSWYTGLGHAIEAYSEPLFRAHLLGGIEWAAGAVAGDCGPTENERYEKIQLDGNTDDPLDMEIDSTGRVFFVERGGAVKVYDPALRLTKLAARLEVLVVHTHGMHGITLDPDFATNHFLYLYYTPLTGTVSRVSRFTFDEATDTVDLASEKVLLTINSQRQVNAHEGGGMTFDAAGNLYVATGDNSAPCCGGFGPFDERAGQENNDAQRSSANTNDLRGKILRIHPEANGTYTIPAGNLFPPGTAQTRPEIYVMGLRNPYRIHIDSETNWLYWGEVGPDAQTDSATRGPRGYDEFNQARSAGNYGWPHCIGPNLPYVDFDFATGVSGAPFDCANGPVNNSPNNTGRQVLPPARGAWMSYPYAVSPTWPELGTGGRLAIGGPVYHFDANLASESKFPAYYDDAMLIADWTRNAIFEVKQDAAGQAFSINRFLPNMTFLRPIDLEFGPDGSLYVIEWGSNYGGSGRGDPNFDSGVYKINYVRPGERSPLARATATPTSGRAPLAVAFSSAGSSDPDAGQTIRFAWDFDGNGTTDSTAANPGHTYTANGDYTARLTVTDPTNRSTVANVPITVGNTAPTVTLTAPADGQIFDFGSQVSFSATVTDPEDGAIDCQQVITQPALGHAQHAHPLDQYRGCAGTIQTIVDDGHTSNDNIFYVVDTKYTDRGATGVSRLTGGDSAILQPRHKESDHYTRQSGTNLFDLQDGTAGKLVGNISHGDWVSFEPVNLSGVDALRFRVASAGAGGFIDVRRGGPTGPVLGSVAVPVTGGWRTWTTVTADITDPGGSYELFLVARNTSSTADLFNVDWLEFVPLIEVATLSVPSPVPAGRSSVAAVTVTNRTGAAVNATVALTVPTGWQTSPVTAPVGAGATATVQVPLTPPAQAPTTGRVSEVDISARATVPGQQAGGVPHARTLLVPGGERSVYALDAGSATSGVLAAYRQLEPATTYSDARGFGWVANTGLQSRDRGGPDVLRRDMVTSQQPATLRLRIPPGRHAVSFLRGDAQFDARRLIVTLDGQRVIDGGLPLAPNQWGWDQLTVDGGAAGRVIDLQLSIDIVEWWRVNAIVVQQLS